MWSIKTKNDEEKRRKKIIREATIHVEVAQGYIFILHSVGYKLLVKRKVHVRVVANERLHGHQQSSLRKKTTFSFPVDSSRQR